jgi:hypothetical protein
MAYAFCCYVKLYDPPMGIALKFTDPNNVSDFCEISSWNENRSPVTSPEIAELKGLETTDRVEMLEKSNHIMSRFVKDNLSKILTQQQSTTIDLLKIIDIRNKKTGGKP